MSQAPKPRHTARAIVVHDGQLLLMERWRDGLHYFSIPGGAIEEGESSEEAVTREVLEETNLMVEIVNLAFEMHHGDSTNKIYLCKYISGEPELPGHAPEFLHTTPNNRFKPGWIPLEQVKDLPFAYWEPLRGVLVEGLEKGFTGEVKIVRVD